MLCDGDGQGRPHHRYIRLSLSSPPHSGSTPITQEGSHYINIKLFGYVDFCNRKRLFILTCL